MNFIETKLNEIRAFEEWCRKHSISNEDHERHFKHFCYEYGWGCGRTENIKPIPIYIPTGNETPLFSRELCLNLKDTLEEIISDAKDAGKSGGTEPDGSANT
jgi:hypothetical protein